MATARIGDPARWRALFGLLRQAGRARLGAFAALILLVGLLPTAVILVTGRLAAAIPAAVASGPAARQPVMVALAALIGCLVALALASNTLGQLGRVLSDAFALALHQAVARVTLGTPDVAPLEDPAVADELQAVQDAERRNVFRNAMDALSGVATTRLRGAGAFVVLLGFRWWAPLVLGLAWHLTNRVYLHATANGVTVQMTDGAVRLRRAEYLRTLAVGAPAAKEVRVFGLGGWLVPRYGDAWLDALELLWTSRKANRAITAAAALALAVSHGLVLGALGVAASRGEVGVAALLVFAQAAIATADLGLLGDPQWHLAQALALAGRVAGLRARVPVPEKPETRSTPAEARSGKVAVRLDGVRFTYRGRERPTLDGLSLEIPAGQSLAIVGENGAGKSTLIKLLCGLYEPDAGRIAVDGGLSPRQARGRIAAIFQDFVRYPLPLRENVGFGRLALMDDDAALEGALRDAGGGALLTRLEHGWDTVLSREFEGGTELSGGQWQRVALARALAAVRGGAGLLVLDEPTAALDVRAETELFERFLELTRDVTTILVSHRLSSVRHADRIVVIDGGRVAEDGTHESLMRAGGLYARMYSLQAERFASEGMADESVADEEAEAHA
ncbi:MAG: putative transporter ATP-binding protein [Gemmatimonadetes bacterium]|nr:putative transporter ATP-binding protein [Gemmatimonadota bacterium]